MNNSIPTRTFGFTPDRLMQMRQEAKTREQEMQDPKDRPKYPWLHMPTTLEEFKPQVGVYTFDVVQFKLSESYHPYLAKTYKIYDLGENAYWYDLEIMIHQNFPQEFVCKRTFGGTYNPLTKEREDDAMCSMLWNNKDTLDRRQFNKTFVLYLLRMYPNATIGNTDYKFMYFIATPGIFANSLREEASAMEAVSDKDNMGFFLYGKEGKSLKVRFTEQNKDLPQSDGTTKNVKWVACSKIDFVDRKDQYTDTDLEFVNSLDMQSYIDKPNMDALQKMADRILGKPAERVATPIEKPTKSAKETLDEIFGDDTLDIAPAENKASTIEW